MSTTWAQGGQPPATGAPRRSVNPPPVCFNCGQEGHFVVACLEPSRLNTGSFPLPPTTQQHPGTDPSPQPYPQGGPPQAQYPPQHQHQPYGPPAPYYSQTPMPQPYGAPPASGHYGRPGYQPPPYDQYPPQNGAPQYGSLGYQITPQQYGPPASAPYQPPPNNYPPPNAGYGENYGASPISHQPLPPQWNNAPPPSRSAPPFQRQQWNMSQSFQRDLSGTPSQHSHQQTPQPDYGSEIHQQTPQTPASNLSNQHVPVQGPQSSSIMAPHESNASSRASTPYGRRESAVSIDHRSVRPGPGTLKGEEPQESVKTEAETQQLEDPEQQFNWDFKYIFKDPPKPESVALAQPLSTTFDMTPVPQVDPRSTRSVSRYARNDNLKEFIRSIRNAPQWSYLQEDPAFTDAKLEGPLIPVEDIPAWIEKRQGIIETTEIETPVKQSRKRAWSDEQDDIDNQIALEAGEEVEDDGHTNKRQKNQEDGELNEHMADAEQVENKLSTSAPETPVLGTLGTPVLGRSGTPCLANVDDAWAPQPGEGAVAISPQDPTEALLASLGVTGSPKPVVDEPLPPYVVPVEDQNESQAKSSSQPQQIVAANAPGPSATPPNSQQGNLHSNEPQNEFQGGPQNAPQYGPQVGHQYGPPSNAPYSNALPATRHGSQPYGPPRSASWSNGPPTNAPYGSTPQDSPSQYNPPMNPPYQNGPATPVPHSNPQYGPPRSASYPNPQYGPPQYNSTPLPNAQYGAPLQYGPPQNSQYNIPQQHGNGPAPHVQYGPPQYTNLRYNNVPQQGPLQYASGPQPLYDVPQAPPQYANISMNLPPYGSTQQPQGHPQYAGGAPNQPPYGEAPPRQDSGYMSARGSYSNGSGQNAFDQNPQNPQNSQPAGQYAPLDNSQQGNQLYSAQQPGGNGQSEEMIRRNSTPGEPGTPLSPTSAEILGKLVRKPSSARKPEPSRQSDETGTRKVKRPQPVVAEAYSRRW